MTSVALCSLAIINMQQPVAEHLLDQAVIARRDGSWRRAMAAGGARWQLAARDGSWRRRDGRGRRRDGNWRWRECSWRRCHRPLYVSVGKITHRGAWGQSRTTLASLIHRSYVRMLLPNSATTPLRQNSSNGNIAQNLRGALYESC